MSGALRLFNQIGRILAMDEMTTITEDVVEAARSTLVIGANQRCHNPAK